MGLDNVFQPFEDVREYLEVFSVLLVTKQFLLDVNTLVDFLQAIRTKLLPKDFVIGELRQIDKINHLICYSMIKYGINCTLYLPPQVPVWKKMVATFWPDEDEEIYEYIRNLRNLQPILFLLSEQRTDPGPITVSQRLHA